MRTPGAGALAPYEALLAQAELELELAGRADIEGLAQLGSRWEELQSALPGLPPPAAGPLLERAGLICERARIELLRIREALLAEQAGTRRAQRAAVGYGRELRRRPRLDRSA